MEEEADSEEEIAVREGRHFASYAEGGELDSLLFLLFIYIIATIPPTPCSG